MENEITNIILSIVKPIPILLFIIWVVVSIIQKKEHSTLGWATLISAVITIVIIFILR